MTDITTGPIPHDASAWAEGRFCAAIRVQVIADLAVRAGFTLPISALQLIEDEQERSSGRCMQALGLYSRMVNISPSMVSTLARQHSYWVGYHNELNKGMSWALGWVKAGKIDAAAQKLVADAVQAAEKDLLAAASQS